MDQSNSRTPWPSHSSIALMAFSPSIAPPERLTLRDSSKPSRGRETKGPASQIFPYAIPLPQGGKCSFRTAGTIYPPHRASLGLDPRASVHVQETRVSGRPGRPSGRARGQHSVGVDNNDRTRSVQSKHSPSRGRVGEGVSLAEHRRTPTPDPSPQGGGEQESADPLD